MLGGLKLCRIGGLEVGWFLGMNLLLTFSPTVHSLPSPPPAPVHEGCKGLQEPAAPQWCWECSLGKGATSSRQPSRVDGELVGSRTASACPVASLPSAWPDCFLSLLSGILALPLAFLKQIDVCL